MKRILLSIISFAAALLPALAQEESQDSLVVLVSSKSAQMVDVEGASYRKVVGPARFLHNNTYLLCDTAYWNVDAKYIEAWGNVSILQEETVLTSDKLTYFVDQDLAQFRGSLVQLQDKDHNVLRTEKYVKQNGTETTTKYIYSGTRLVHMTQGSNWLHFFYDGSGQPHICIDEYMKRRLQIKLIHSIVSPIGD